MTRQGRFSLLLVPLLAIIASACATETLRIEAATDVAEKAKGTAAASREFLGQVDQARTAINVDVIAADPACGTDRSRVRARPNAAAVRDVANPPRGWLCEPLPAGTAASNGINLRPIGTELGPTLELIRSLAAYADALNEIVGAPAPNPLGDLDNALALGRAGQGLLSGLTGRTVSVVPAADDKRLGAVRDFIAFVNDLNTQRERSLQLQLLAQRGTVGGALIGKLTEHLDLWEQSRLESERASVRLSGLILNAALNAPRPVSAALRRQLAQNYFDRERAAQASGKVFDALNVALEALRQGEEDYQQLLRDRPTLNERQRARRAQLIRERIVRGLNIATAILTAFRGV